MSNFDRRITPARADLAAAHLKGKIDAPRYAEAKTFQVIRGRAALRSKPSDDAGLDTELLHGERFNVYDVANGWAWGQSPEDDYAGYVRADSLSEDVFVADHRVTTQMTPVFPSADLKKPVRDFLPLNATVKIASREGVYARIGENAFVFAGHLAPIHEIATDWVEVAERFLRVPYVWGGKTAAGLDCSGLIQTSMQAAGLNCPRDTDMQENGVGHPVDHENLHRGDLIFWKGHVGVMLDKARLLHANAFHMDVSIEPLSEAVARIENVAGAITSVKRL